ncbi:Peroxidase 4 [Hibiscus syriacus]|uniref:Peroxidase n=1 Tax=Hibiscus syriacus TaxID=106335 RepID=A0A6A3BAY1_HIBSY|nr:Peroxidase 4 [Hibiscus syriacus]
MASVISTVTLSNILLILLLSGCSANAQLSANFYANSCPNLQTIAHNAMTQAVNREERIGASILCLFFHDCFVNGCDASILLDDTSTFTGEKNAVPNRNSARGYAVIDTIKSNVEAGCNATVSCADILPLAARDGVVVQDRDGVALAAWRTYMASLCARDLTALSGGHTIGLARCTTFRSRIYNDTNINANFAATRRANCPATGGDNNLAPLDTLTSTRFDNNHYRDLVAQRGLLHSDQELFNEGSQDALVQTYSNNPATFSADFAAAMVRMGNISPLIGTSGENRRNCRVVN